MRAVTAGGVRRGCTMRRRRPILKRGGAAAPMPGQPLIGAAHADAGRGPAAATGVHCW